MSDNIPFEIQMEIVSKLSVDALVEFRTVSKKWKSFIDNSDFVVRFGVRPKVPRCFLIMFKLGFVESKTICFVDNKFNISQNIFPFPSHPNVIFNTSLRSLNLVPIGTSHGVWCFSDSFKFNVLWNPSLRKSVAIRIPCWSSESESDKVAVGFGVNPHTYDPTVLRISYPVHGHGPWNVTVFRLSVQCWEKLENERLPRQSIRLKRSSQVVLGSFIYWAASERIFHSDGVSSHKCYMLVCFDLVNLRFSVLDIPEPLRDWIPVPFYISKLGESIVIYGNIIGEQWHTFCLWKLNLDGGDKIKAFKTLFNIFTPHVLKLHGFTNTGDPIFESDKPYQMDHTLEVFQVRSQEFINLGVEADAGSFFMSPYNESLILLTHPDCSIY